jgi:hypothetical protein
LHTLSRAPHDLLGKQVMNDISQAKAGAPRRAASVARAVRSVVAVLLVSHLVLLYPPWRFTNPGAGLESSWQQVITYAAASGWQWGRDIGWTYGPFGFTWYAVYFEPLLEQVLLVRSLFIAALAIGVVGILARTPTVWALITYAVIAFAGSMLGPGIYAFIPLLAALNYFRDSGNARLPWTVPLVVVSGILALTYGSSGVLSLALFLLMDLSRIVQRRFPIFVPLMAGAVLAGFLVAGQSLSILPDYLRSLLELIAGYSDAMSVEGHGVEVIAFLALGLLSAALVVRCEFSSLMDSRTRVDSLLLLGCMAVFWFVMFKTGFVRHDLHSVWAWAGLAIGLAGYVATRDVVRSNWMRAAAILGVAVASSSVEAMLVHGGDRISFVAAQARKVFLQVPAASLTEAREVLMNHRGWRSAMQQRRDAAKTSAGQRYAELRIPGTVDMMGTAQGALLLQDVDFLPRPVFQDFSAYTPWLIELNRAHLRGSRAAERILLSTEAIDNRYPMMDRGNAVLELLALYRPERIAAEYLVLRRRDASLNLTLSAMRDREAVLGQWIEVDSSEAPVILNADIRPNALGLLARLLYRLPQLELTVKLADGTERSHRIVPAYSREGMLLSPYIEGVISYAAMAAGIADAASGNRVVAIKVDANGQYGRVYFKDSVPVRFSSIRMPQPDSRLDGSDLRRILERRLTVNQMANSAVPRSPLLSAQETLLLAHPPVTASLPVLSAHQLQAAYGVSDGAWKDGRATDGVCFRIFATGSTGERTKLHERCLRPVERTEDRGEHRVTLPLSIDNPGTLVFETDCGGNCSWDWAYWKDIDVAP